jgi:hypothetical protein
MTASGEGVSARKKLFIHSLYPHNVSRRCVTQVRGYHAELSFGFQAFRFCGDPAAAP